MASLTLLLASLLPLATSQFIPPEAILQAGYPAGFRAFVPDFPGCQQFAFHGKINSPFLEDNELGSIFQEILRPQDGFWIVQDFKLILTPGDIIHYWTNLVKDGVSYAKHNQTWKVPGPEGSVDILSPIKPPKKSPPLKVTNTEPPLTEEATTPKLETDATVPTTIEETTPSFTETSTPSTTVTTLQTSPSTTTTTAQTPTSTTKSTTTTETPSSTTKSTTTTQTTTTSTTTTKKPPTSEKRETQKPKNAKNPSAPMEDIEELTTPSQLERQIPEELPGFPFPGLFPQPFKPMMPAEGPGFEICSNPWNFEERIGETRTQKLERQVAKLQCQLALFQRGYNQLSNTVETELTDLKKLMYGMVSRMASLESVLRSTPFG